VGAAKAGTTALHAILSQHPEIYMSPVKEPNFFCKDIKVNEFSPLMKKKYLNRKCRRTKFGEILPQHQLYIQSLNEYLKLFDRATKNHKIRGEASVSYLFSEIAAQEIYKFNPEAKIIILLRDPVERAFSHYLMDRKVGNNKISNFVVAVENDYNRSDKAWGNSHLYIELGLYYNQIKRYLDVFDRENIFLIQYNQFKDNNQLITDQITRFLKIDDLVLSKKGTQKNITQLPKNRFIQFLLNSKSIKRQFRNYASPYIKNKLKKIILSNKNLPVLSADIKEKILPYFKDDIEKLNKKMSFYFDK
ncbi:MAG TPA: sulfotransferase, partial [Aequorivita sp.]|nr:sulfotransferase [Aequorivita sp.]